MSISMKGKTQSPYRPCSPGGAPSPGRSQYRSVPAPHSGLGLSTYAQATSPMRRYLDLVVRQQLHAY